MAKPFDFHWDGPHEFVFEGKLSLKDSASNKIRWPSERIVYMLKFKPPYFVKYKNEQSAVCYIGKGSDARRIAAHRGNWFQKVAVVLEGFEGFQAFVCQPRAKNFLSLFKDVEGDAISTFKSIFGERPLFNQRDERSPDHEYSHKVNREIREHFSLGDDPSYSKIIKSPLG
jgi:hypothetical protein